MLRALVLHGFIARSAPDRRYLQVQLGAGHLVLAAAYHSMIHLKEELSWKSLVMWEGILMMCVNKQNLGVLWSRSMNGQMHNRMNDRSN